MPSVASQDSNSVSRAYSETEFRGQVRFEQEITEKTELWGTTPPLALFPPVYRRAPPYPPSAQPPPARESFRSPPPAREGFQNPRFPCPCPSSPPFPKSAIRNPQSAIPPFLHFSITPFLHHSISPSLHFSITPFLHPIREIRVIRGQNPQASQYPAPGSPQT
jgi:hypothetical protein